MKQYIVSILPDDSVIVSYPNDSKARDSAVLGPATAAADQLRTTLRHIEAGGR